MMFEDMKVFSQIEKFSIWAIFGGLAGIASFLNKFINDPQTGFSYFNLVARGFIGLVVGVVLASFIETTAPNLVIPASAIGGWFSTEMMNMLQNKFSK